MRYRNPATRSTWPMGTALIVLGVALLIATQTGLGGELITLAIGLLFLVAYVVQRRYAFLVAGSILAGLGAGVVLDATLGGRGTTPIFGLGLGFLAIFAVDGLRGLHRAHWWPLVPGAVLLLAGLDVATGSQGPLHWLAAWWPVALVAIGVVLIVGSASRSHPSV